MALAIETSRPEKTGLCGGHSCSAGVTIHFFSPNKSKNAKKPWGLVSGLQKSTTKTIPNMFWSWQPGQQCFQWPHHL